MDASLERDPADSARPLSDEHHLDVRVRAEYRELPGLKLTLAQASRLFNVDLERCARVFDALVYGGVLDVSGRAFVRADYGQRGGREKSAECWAG